nr:hypothetical protein HMPREF0276_1788 [Corynebacterium accolens ATCC 49725]
MVLCRALTAHPRSRGEHGTPGVPDSLVEGSSPLTRGAPWSGNVAIFAWGLIPAHAGSTAMVRPSTSN